MKPYNPLPQDQLQKAGLTLTIDRVFPEQVAFSFSNGDGPFTIPRHEFDLKAQGSFKSGASLIRDGQTIWPAPTSTPEPTEPTEPTEPKSEGLTGSANTHARLSPSDSKRWTNCLAAIAFEEANAHRVKKNDSSSYADEGTDAHEYAAQVLLGETKLEDIPKALTEPVGLYTSMCQGLVPTGVLTHLDSCVEDAELGLDPPDDAYFVEEQIPLFYQPVQTGTADFLGLRSVAGVVTHFYGRDYKHGAGVLVDSQDNTQLAIYVYSAIVRLEGAYQFPDDAEINLSVVQPRHREADNQTPWIITLADLRTFCEDIENQAVVSRRIADEVREKIGSPGTDISNDDILAACPDAVFAPGEGDGGACRWCKCKAFCVPRQETVNQGLELPSMSAEDMLACMPVLDKEEKKEQVEERLDIVSDRLGSKGRIITDEYLVQLVARTKDITSFLSDAKEYLEGRLLDGEEIDGVKLVEGQKGDRAWANEEEAETFLRGQKLRKEERFDYKIKSPTNAEKILKAKLKKSTRTRKRFESLITRSDGKKKLAISDDVRQAVPPNLAVMPTYDDDDFEV